MRRTVALDPDVEKLIRNAMLERGISFKEALNEAVRAGLSGERRKCTRKFVQRTFSMGQVQGFRWDKAMAMSDAMEDEERTRKLF